MTNPAASLKPLQPLMLGNLVVGSGSLVIAGILQPISQELQVSVAQVGQLSSVYALAFAIGAPAMSLLLSNWCRKRVLTLALLLFAAASLWGAVAGSYTSLIASRVLAGVAGAMFSPNAAAVAALLVSPEQRGRAIATVFGGFTLATVLGVPLGTYLGLHIGWRETLAVMGAASLLMTGFLHLRLPGNFHTAPVNLRSWLQLGSDVQVVMMLGVSLLQIAGTYVVFSFMGPFVMQGMKASADQVALVMLLFGAAGFAGNWISGRVIDRVGSARMAAINISLVIIGLVLVAVSPSLGASQVIFMLLGIAIWGGAVFAINTAQQTRLVQHAPQLASSALPANSSLLFAGQALGGAVGGYALASGLSMAALPLVGAGMAMLALGVSLSVSRKVSKSAV